MRLPIPTSFTAHFIAQPLCYTRLPAFVGIAVVGSIRYSCILTAGFVHGEEIMRDDFSDQHRFSIPITSVEYFLRMFIFYLRFLGYIYFIT
jgi:hypothetical protein